MLLYGESVTLIKTFSIQSIIGAAVNAIMPIKALIKAANQLDFTTITIYHLAGFELTLTLE